jgi:hypothetical protein
MTTRLVHDCATGDVVEVALTAAEIAERDAVASGVVAVEAARSAAKANERTIDTFLDGALVTLQTIIDTAPLSLAQADLRNLQQQVKDLARIQRRLVRKQRRAFDTAT